MGDIARVMDRLATDGGRAEINLVDTEGDTPLFCALENSRVEIEMVRLLLEAGADPAFVKKVEIAKMPEGIDIEGSLKELGIDLGDFDLNADHSYTTSLMSLAAGSGNLQIVKLLSDFGADFLQIDEDGTSALHYAVGAKGDKSDLVEYLLEIGVPLDVQTSYGETALKSAARAGNYKVTKQLISAGADQSVMNWTPLMWAVAIGTEEEVEQALRDGADLNAQGEDEHTALDIALRKGDETIVEKLLNAGASAEKDGSTPPLIWAVESGNIALVQRLLNAGCDVNAKDFVENSPIGLAAARGDRAMVQLFLDRGANPSKGDSYDSYISNAKDRETILLMLEAGADETELDQSGRRTLAGLGPGDPYALRDLSRDEYFRARYDREGNANPEDMTEPYRLAMVRYGGNAYHPRVQFEDPPTFTCGIKGQKRPPQVWCFDRFGQSATAMPDGRTILIAGEHEDYYDPDFCIYNDVTVVHPDGKIQVFGYPHRVFEPTDFHSATLVGEDILIIGGLGYMDQRKGPIPVYRLDTRTYSIEKVSSVGKVPNRVSRHRAKLEGDEIVISGGEAVVFKWGKESHVPNEKQYRLNTKTLSWSAE